MIEEQEDDENGKEEKDELEKARACVLFGLVETARLYVDGECANAYANVDSRHSPWEKAPKCV